MSKMTFFLLKAIPKAPIEKIRPENIKKQPKLNAVSALWATQQTTPKGLLADPKHRKFGACGEYINK
jgi:hypothetical protein